MSSAGNLSLPEPFSNKNKDSHQYSLTKVRFLDIIEEIKDTVADNKSLKSSDQHLDEQKLQESTDEALNGCSEIIEQLVELEDQIKENSILNSLMGDAKDVGKWNDYLQMQEDMYGERPRWFHDRYLLVECYFYRKIKEIFEKSRCMKSFDPFLSSKMQSMIKNQKSAVILADMLSESESVITDPSANNEVIFPFFMKFLSLCLWGNRCDLLTTKGVIKLAYDPSAIEQLNQNIIVNDSTTFWKILKDAKEKKGEKVTLAFILDNAGFELFSDLCFAHFLQKANLVHQVHFYPKDMPWFISDVVYDDFMFALDNIKDAKEEALSSLGRSLMERISNGTWKLVKSSFWTLPHQFFDMKTIDPELYSKLSEADAVIFKGDLNYRKVVGDLQWDFDTPFETALVGFLPTSLCCIRCIKAPIAAGLKDVSSEIKTKLKTDWKGTYALIQCAMKLDTDAEN